MDKQSELKGWREVYVATKQARLATAKLYSVVRHPQYTGIFLQSLAS